MPEFSSTGGFSLGDPITKLDNITAVLKGIVTVHETRSRLKIGLIIIIIIISAKAETKRYFQPSLSAVAESNFLTIRRTSKTCLSLNLSVCLSMLQSRTTIQVWTSKIDCCSGFSSSIETSLERLLQDSVVVLLYTNHESSKRHLILWSLFALSCHPCTATMKVTLE